MVIVIGGMIGLGKTTTAATLSKGFSLPVFYESVKDNTVLPLFYTASPEESRKNRYPFLLQLSFLSSRFEAIRQALKSDNAILDRSLYEDYYFAKVNHYLGNISDMEFSVYEKLFHEMMASLKDLQKSGPDVMVYLRGSFETVLDRIQERGRSFELDRSLRSYYHTLWEGYDDWMMNMYNASPVLTVDVDKYDINVNEADKEWLLRKVAEYQPERK